ncbi:DNA-directed RNA polymerase subunit beta' [Candidatus Woesebacteria bacterium]|nr:DNA-directed RNA polymerase subunit beta' [Candidatus Woesebacteria bacterium]
MEPLANLKSLTDLVSLRIKLAAPSDIRKWSRGEITKPETINYRTLKPEKDGLFDERIFGPTKDWECYCGKYKRIRYKGVVCDKCGVEVTQSRVRRERMGHIALASPVVHVWFFKGAPSKVSLLLDVAPRAIEQVIYFARYIALSVNEKEKKVAVKHLSDAQVSRTAEIEQFYKQRQETLAAESEQEKEKLAKKIKDKEQLILARGEVELNQRKKEAAVLAEQKETVEKTNTIFENLIALVKNLKTFSIISEEEFDQLWQYQAANFFDARMGAEAIEEALKTLDLEKLAAGLRGEMENTTSARFVKLAKRLKLIDGLRRAKIEPSWVILRVLPVLPPDLRPMVQLSGGRFATSDLNDLYRRVINRNNRLKHLIDLGAPEIILRNEKRMLQEAVDSLIDASQRKATRRGRGRQPLRSLSDMLRGKQGRFRQNLLGKRVDYSGRSVIIVGPELKINQCGIPKEMALEIFKPFVLREMISRGIAPNVKSAKNMLERRPAEVFDILEEITRDHPVLLNRAPTLHKLSIQAFYPVLIEGRAIRIHPAICSGFNADFDGDQMAVHVPLSKAAIAEAKSLMLPQKNLLKPANATPVSTPSSKEMALGVYYFTSVDPSLEPYKSVFADREEAIHAYQTVRVKLRQLVSVRVDAKIIETTVGRILFNEMLPPSFGFINESLSSSHIKDIFSKAYAMMSEEEVVELLDNVKAIGFAGGTLAGISFGVFDSELLPQKREIVAEADKKVAEIENNFAQGLITEEEKKRLSQEVWIEVTEELTDKTWDNLSKDNPVRVFVDAKAGRVSRDQVKQLAAIRGLIVDPLGRIVELPIKSNFREGLSVFEYVTSARGSRKGLTDTALKTADAGYLTRRLVDVAHDMIIKAKDCGTTQGYKVRRGSRNTPLAGRIVGRFAAQDVVNAAGEVICAKGDLIDEDLARTIDAGGVDEVTIFSPLTCQLRYGICVKCYGWDLSNKKIVEEGTPVGVVAAQSIGEPGTQLTLKSKHAGGIVGLDVTQGLPRVEELFEARTPKILSPLSEIAGKVRIAETEEGWKVNVTSVGKPKEEREYLIAKTVMLVVEDGQLVDVGTQLAEASLDIKEVLSVRGLQASQEYLVNQVQAVYESQGIPINDKHFEVIVRKMSDKVKIATAGDTSILPGELVDRATFEEENEKVLAAGGEPASAQQIVLGITKRALFTESWLSAASFEQTTDVLTDAATSGREDRLLGLKENVIIGRLIPVTEATSLPQAPTS